MCVDGRLHILHKEGEVERRSIGAKTDYYFRVGFIKAAATQDLQKS